MRTGSWIAATLLCLPSAAGCREPPPPPEQPSPLIGYWVAEFRRTIPPDTAITRAELTFVRDSAGASGGGSDTLVVGIVRGQFRRLLGHELRGSFVRVELHGTDSMSMGFGDGDERGEVALAARLAGDAASGHWERVCDCPPLAGVFTMRRPR